MSNEEKTNKIITILLALVITLAAVTIIYVNLTEEKEEETQDQQNGTDDKGSDDNKTNEAVILTVIFGDEEVNYRLEDLKVMNTTIGYGGYKTNFPAIKGQGTYTGVPIITLVENIAGEIVNYSIIVISDENGLIENLTYNYDMILGYLDIYNATNASDDIPVDTGNVTMILCYKKDGEYLDVSEDGKLKIAFINEKEEKITKSSLWQKFVVSIEIIED